MDKTNRVDEETSSSGDQPVAASAGGSNNKLLVGAVAAVLLVGGVAAGLALAGGSDEPAAETEVAAEGGGETTPDTIPFEGNGTETTEPADDGVATTQPADEPAEQPVDQPVDEPTDTDPPAEEAPADQPERPFVEPTPNPTEWPGYPEDPDDAPASGPYIIIKNGDFFLRGAVSTEELRQQMAWFTLDVVPAENVVVEYYLDPNDPFVLGDTIPVFFADLVLFDVNSERVNEEDIRDLAILGVAFLQTNPTAVFTLIGHTDSSGPDDVNLALSQRRASAVRDFYLSLGAPPDQVFAVGMGEAEPIADNDTAEGRAQNRRVEFKFTNEG